MWTATVARLGDGKSEGIDHLEDLRLSGVRECLLNSCCSEQGLLAGCSELGIGTYQLTYLLLTYCLLLFTYLLLIACLLITYCLFTYYLFLTYLLLVLLINYCLLTYYLPTY